MLAALCMTEDHTCNAWLNFVLKDTMYSSTSDVLMHAAASQWVDFDDDSFAEKVGHHGLHSASLQNKMSQYAVSTRKARAGWYQIDMQLFEYHTLLRRQMEHKSYPAAMLKEPPSTIAESITGSSR